MTAQDVAALPADQVRRLYTELALHPEKNFGWGKGTENARSLGYEERWLGALPAVAWESAAAVGNPFSLGSPHAGEIVVDIGCGCGADLCIAALLIGERGRAIGIDVTPAMVAKARVVIDAMGLTNVELYEADMAACPLPYAFADLVISNAAINLSPRKACVFNEIFRILKPSGRVQLADMVRVGSVEDSERGPWADCVAGTVAPERYLEILTAAGFVDAELVSFTGYKTAVTTMGATFRARKPQTRTW